MPDHLKSWIAENILIGSDLEQLAQMLIARGFSAQLVETEIETAQQSPYLQGAARQQTILKKRNSLLKSLDHFHRLDPDYLTLEKKPVPPFAEFLREYYSKNRPGLFSGAADHWPARGWTPQLLLDIVGEQTLVELQGNRDSEAKFEVEKAKLKRTMPFGEFIRRVECEETNDVYLTANNMALGSNVAFSSLLQDVGNIADGYLDMARLDSGMFLWVGPKGTITPLHHDATNNLFAQIYGTKRFHLIPAMQAPYVYNRHAVFSDVDLLNPDLAQHPHFAHAASIEVTVGPGDFLFLPACWWHHVVSESASISLTFNNVNAHNYLIDYPEDLGY